MLGLALVSVVFFIVTPETPLSRGIALALTATMLLVTIVTGRGSLERRRIAALAAGVFAFGVAIAVVFDGLPGWVASAVGAVLVVGTTVELVLGLVGLLRSRGVTLQAVSGALAVYLLLGLFFSLLVTFAARVGNGAFFSQGTDGTQSVHVYYAFTTMTTTGYGDYTPAAPFGRSLAVVAMLMGQIYLVTVIGLLVGNLRGARAARAHDAQTGEVADAGERPATAAEGGPSAR